ncbi:MAG: biotin carboxylase N-terminal domain-containing protein [Deltaproteobacteria bacterium]
MGGRSFQRILVANRGEIAIRIIRTIKTLGLVAIAVYETTDKDAYFLRFADTAIHIGEGPNKDYLDIKKIINAAKTSGADAIHPGSGFLSESAEFARACEQNDIVFIGPSSDILETLGTKTVAKKIASSVNIQTISGTEAIIPDEQGFNTAKAFVAKHGYPILVKATAGGGGIGIRRIESDAELNLCILSASTEAMHAFGDERIYIEKCIARPKHVEVQILADCYGNIVHLGTRDCSIQRRHQKLIEVAPANLPASVLESIQSAAVKIAKEAKYTNAGTVEFLVDADTHEFWFMEVNARLQVEHTITEMLTEIDIVEQQIKIAEGRKLTLQQEHVVLNGVAIEVRINAEDPKNNFMPDGGKFIEAYQLPGGPGIRVDSAIYKGYRIPTCYDSLLAKLIVKGYQWDQTVQRLKRSLSDFIIIWPKTTIPLYIAMCDETDFKSRDFRTDYIEKHSQLFNYQETEYYVLDGSIYKTNSFDDTNFVAKNKEAKQALSPQAADSIATHENVKSTIKGRVVNLLVEMGEEVEAGNVLIELEAMKMHTFVSASSDGRVIDILVEDGDSVDVDDILIILEQR